MTDQLLLWIDKETDSLDARDCLTLETAGFMTTSDLHVLRGTEFHYLLDMSAEAVRVTFDGCDEYVRQMHTDNGLWDALLGKTELGLDRIPQHVMDARLTTMVLWAGEQDPAKHLFPGEESTTRRPEEGYPKKPRIAGSGVAAFDVQIVRFQYPQLRDVVDYTGCDVSNTRRFLQDQCGWEFEKEPNRPHRAHQDALHAWLEAIDLVDQLSLGAEASHMPPEF